MLISLVAFDQTGFFVMVIPRGFAIFVAKDPQTNFIFIENVNVIINILRNKNGYHYMIITLL